MDLESITLSEISQTKKIPNGFTYMHNLKNKIKSRIRSINAENKLMVIREEGMVGGQNE